MLTDEEIEILIKIKTNPVGPEYHQSSFISNINHTFEKGSYDNYIYKMFRDIEENGPIFFKNLDSIKMMINNTFELPTSIINNRSELLAHEKYLLDKRKENLISSIEHYLADWIVVSDSMGVDISEEIEFINNIKDSIQDNLISLLYKEDKKIKNYISKIKEPSKVIYDKHSDIEKKTKANTQKINTLDNLVSFVNDPSTLLTNLQKHEQSIKYLFDKDGVYEKLNKINETIEKIVEKVRNSSDVSYLSRADYFSTISSQQTASSVSDFVFSKSLAEHSVSKVILNNHNTIKEIILFKEDHSVLLVDKNNRMSAINRTLEKELLINDILLNELNYILRKKPTISKIFNNLYINHDKNFQKAYLTAKTYLDYESIFKNGVFDIIKEQKIFNSDVFPFMSKTPFEHLDDSMNAVALKHKIKQYAHSISSNKYDELYNDKSYTLIKQLYNENIPASELQNMIGKKMATFQTPEDFNKSLSQLYSHYTSFSIYSLNKKVKENNIDIISDKDNVIVLHIENFNQSKAIGSNSWCISRSQYYFDSYTKDKNKQYFIYDFNKDSQDNSSVIGITINESGTLRAAYYKNDADANKDPIINDLKIKIIREHLSSYPHLSRSVKDEVNSNLSLKSKIFNMFKR